MKVGREHKDDYHQGGSMRGLTLYICFGRYGGFKVNVATKPFMVRLSLGWMAVSLLRMDIESVLEHFLIRCKG